MKGKSISFCLENSVYFPYVYKFLGRLLVSCSTTHSRGKTKNKTKQVFSFPPCKPWLIYDDPIQG